MIQELKIIPDFRAPDNIRLGVNPLYTSFSEIQTAVERMQRIVMEKLYEKYPAKTSTVT
jgi:kynureninase